MDAQQIVYSQYLAALEMLKGAVVKCPDNMWDDVDRKNRFWHVAYHTLFYTDLYLSRDEASFQAHRCHREHYQFFGQLPWPPHEAIVADQPIPRDDILDYIEHCRQKAADIISAETAESLAGPPGFWWYEIPRAEFHLNNLRHIQHHGAQMGLSLRRAEGVAIDWVATG